LKSSGRTEVRDISKDRKREAGFVTNQRGGKAKKAEIKNFAQFFDWGAERGVREVGLSSLDPLRREQRSN